jgi:hypothetical protein
MALKSHISKLMLSVPLALAFGSGVARAECNPVDFFVLNIKSVQISDDVKIAFLETATEAQYNSATDGAGISLGFGPVQGKLNFDQARASARQEASLRHWSYDRSYFENILVKAVSRDAANQYSKCLEADQSTIGLRLSIDHVTGNYVFLKGMWIGQDAGQGVGKTNPGSIFQHVKPVRVPETWLKGVTQTIVAERDPTADALISISVSGREQSIVIPRDHTEAPTSMSVISAKQIGASSGGSSDGNSDWVRPHAASACLTPQHPGGYLVMGSGNVTDMTRVGDTSRATWRVTTDTPQQICIQIDSSTPAKEHVNSISLRPIAIERYPVDAQRVTGG